MQIRRVLVDSQEDLQKFCGVNLFGQQLGCATGGFPSSSCTIYALRDKGFDDHKLIETQGHELKHCFEGPSH